MLAFFHFYFLDSKLKLCFVKTKTCSGGKSAPAAEDSEDLDISEVRDHYARVER